MQFADTARLAAAASTLGEVTRDDDARVLQVSTDGGVRSLRTVLDRLDHAAIAVEGLSVHTSELDDVFFALTGHANTQKGMEQ